MSFRKILKPTLVLLCAAMFFTLLPGYRSEPAFAKTTVADMNAKINSLKDELAKATAARKKAANNYNSVKDDYEDIKKRKTAIDEEIDAINSETEVLKQLVAGYALQKSDIDLKISETQKKLDDRLEVLKERLRLSYEDGSSNYLTILFSSNGLNDFLTSADRLSVLVERDNDLINECEKISVELEEQKKELDRVVAEADTKSSELRESMILLQQKQDEVVRMMDEIQADRDAANKALLQAEKEEAAFRKELEKRLAELAELQKNEYSGGAFLWPLPSKYNKISSKFGNRIHPVLGTPQFHKGIDIPAPKNTEIYCVAKGTVIETGNDYGNGKYVIVDHGGGISTMYAHLNKMNVKKGDVLEKGEVLGCVGMTGYATGYHLHLSVYKDGKAVNPVTYFK